MLILIGFPCIPSTQLLLQFGIVVVINFGFVSEISFPFHILTLVALARKDYFISYYLFHLTELQNRTIKSSCGAGISTGKLCIIVLDATQCGNGRVIPNG